MSWSGYTSHWRLCGYVITADWMGVSQIHTGANALMLFVDLNDRCKYPFTVVSTDHMLRWRKLPNADVVSSAPPTGQCKNIWSSNLERELLYKDMLIGWNTCDILFIYRMIYPENQHLVLIKTVQVYYDILRIHRMAAYPSACSENMKPFGSFQAVVFLCTYWWQCKCCCVQRTGSRDSRGNQCGGYIQCFHTGQGNRTLRLVDLYLTFLFFLQESNFEWHW